MSICYRTCPCCEQKIHKCLFLTRKVNNGCEYKTNYKSFYCPHCKNKIMNSYHVILEPILGIIGFAIIYTLSKQTIEFLSILPNMPLTIKLIPLFIVYFFIMSCLSVSILNLKCVSTKKEKKNISKVDNKLIDDMLEFDEEIRITPLEKTLARQTILTPYYYFIMIIIIALLLYIFK